jgi:16S rRNA (guanine527-N7)-methyltransferase
LVSPRHIGYNQNKMDNLIKGAQELGLSLSQIQLGQFDIYYRELIDWNSRINLTSITNKDDVYVKHFLDSLSLFPAFKNDASAPRVIDIGAGAGFPGLPLKIALPDIRLVLLEATAKKVDFLKYIIEKLALDGADVVAARAEEAAHQPEYRRRFDYALSRAVAGMAALAELTLPFCNIGGRLIAQKKGDIAAEVAGAEKAVRLMGGVPPQLKKVELEALSDERYLVIVDKIEDTPEKYPRRPGMPAKRPVM